MSPLWLMDYGSEANYVMASLYGTRHSFLQCQRLIIFICQTKKESKNDVSVFFVRFLLDPLKKIWEFK